MIVAGVVTLCGQLMASKVATESPQWPLPHQATYVTSLPLLCCQQSFSFEFFYFLSHP